MPLLKNAVITRDTLFIKDWYCKAIKTVGDIIDNDLNVLNMNTLVQKFVVQPIDFLIFH